MHDVEIAVGPDNEERAVPLFGHSSADEDLGVPKLSRIEVMNKELVDTYNAWFDGSPPPEGCGPPPSYFIENKDGGSITLGQFVTEVHGYLNEHMDETIKALAMFAKKPVNERIFFRCVWPVRTQGGNIRLAVSLSPKENRASMDEFWATNLHYARRHQQSYGGEHTE